MLLGRGRKLLGIAVAVSGLVVMLADLHEGSPALTIAGTVAFLAGAASLAIPTWKCVRCGKTVWW